MCTVAGSKQENIRNLSVLLSLINPPYGVSAKVARQPCPPKLPKSRGQEINISKDCLHFFFNLTPTCVSLLSNICKSLMKKYKFRKIWQQHECFFEKKEKKAFISGCVVKYGPGSVSNPYGTIPII